MFEGSMCGVGAVRQIVFVFLLAKADAKGFVSVNPKVIALHTGEHIERVEEALNYLQQPDAQSRNKKDEGRRIVREGEYQYRIVNYETYREMRSADDKREYDRNYHRKRRSKCSGMNDSRIESHSVADGRQNRLSKGTSKGKGKGTLNTLVDSPNESTSESDQVALVVGTWNRITRGKLPKAIKATDTRKRLIAARLKEDGWFEDFKKACVFVSTDCFYLGETDDNYWVATIDYLLRAGKATELGEKQSALEQRGMPG
jgi:hypothetical protein